MQHDTPGQRLRELRRRRAISIRELAQRSGVSDRTIGNLERGASEANHPSTWSKVLRALNVDPEDFFTPRPTGIPFFERIPASPPVFVGEAATAADHYMPQQISDALGFTDPTIYAVTVHGESMAPTYRHGDLIFCRPIDPSTGVSSGQAYIVWLSQHHDGAGTLKRVIVRFNQKWLLVPENEKFDLIEVEPEDITRMDRVLGVVRPDPGVPLDLGERVRRLLQQKGT